MKFYTLLFLFAYTVQSFGQIKIDTSFSFQSDPSKKVSLYIPSSYQTNIKSPLMIGLHPWNTNRWNAKVWRDSLTDFAETNGFILMCPDGGNDGQIDDPIDLAFTDAMIDSIANWYTVDKKRTYLMGFSWGGKTTYTYGLKRPQVFCGYVPIGAAINIREIAGISDSIKGKPIYIIHGSGDAPGTRFTPLKNEMIAKGGIVNSHLHTAGHVIDFPDWNNELSKAYLWLDSVCTYEPHTTNLNEVQRKNTLSIYPNPVKQGDEISISLTTIEDGAILEIYSLSGELVCSQYYSSQKNTVQAPSQKGTYIVRITSNNKVRQQKITVN